jgi:hypothetical protein
MEAIKKILRTPTAFVLLLVAIITLIGIIVKGEFDKSIARIPIDATSTAETRLTEKAIVPGITQIVNITETPLSTIEYTLTLVQIPTPTSWPLGTITLTDPGPLCTITVRDFHETGRENAKSLQFSVTGKGGYCSWIIPLNGYNATSKKQITFWVKGEKGGEQYVAGIKDRNTISGQEPKVSKTASASWTQVSIPMDMFKRQNLSSLEYFSLNFTVGSGTIYVDQLIFTP